MRKKGPILIGLLLGGSLIYLFWISLQRSHEIRFGKRVPAAQRVMLKNLSHQKWTELLQEFVDSDGGVRYRKWLAEKRAVQVLDEYLAELSRADLEQDSTAEEKLAFWINAYNALTVRGILLEYPTTSIRNHTSRVGGYNLWHHLLLRVGDQDYSLDRIEHDILRKMNEPRIHFAIVCASKGCPRLLDEAYQPFKVDQQLDENATDFFSREENFARQADGAIYLSSILDWFASDFGATPGEVFEFIRPYLPEQSRQSPGTSFSFRYLPYDWSLNEH